MCLDRFFSEWDDVERIHPWGVLCFTPLFSGFDVPLSLCAEVDDRLFLDLMNQVHPNIHRIKVEGRYSEALFWVYVELRYQSSVIVVSVQRHPNAPMERSLVVEAVPGSLVACILAFHRWMIRGDPGRGAVCRWKNRELAYDDGGSGGWRRRRRGE